MATKKPTKVPKLDQEEIPGDVLEEQQHILGKVLAIQREIDQLNERASEEILHVEQKYNKLRTPHFVSRSSLISQLHFFWPATLMNNPQFAEIISDEDETALQYLENLTVEEYEDVRSGYKITFYFKPNPYFENTTLSKEYMLETTGDTSVIGSKIIWKEGKDLTYRPDTTQENKEDKKRVLEDVPSFFCWFSETESSDDAAEFIKDDIWPNPLQYYFYAEAQRELNESAEDDLEYDEDEDEEEDLDGIEDEDGEADSDPDEVVLGDEDEDDDEDDV